MKYRPEGFYEAIAMMPTNQTNVIEFVADAMLEALRHMSFDPQKALGLNNLFCNHKVVFIPDDTP